MKTVLNVKVDPKLKKDAQDTAKSMGIPLSLVVGAGLRQFVNTRSITFSDEPLLKPEVEAGIRKIEADIAARKNLSPSLSYPKDIEVYLNKL